LRPWKADQELGCHTVGFEQIDSALVVVHG
jgi:hypothetical protein